MKQILTITTLLLGYCLVAQGQSGIPYRMDYYEEGFNSGQWKKINHREQAIFSYVDLERDRIEIFFVERDSSGTEQVRQYFPFKIIESQKTVVTAGFRYDFKVEAKNPTTRTYFNVDRREDEFIYYSLIYKIKEVILEVQNGKMGDEGRGFRTRKVIQETLLPSKY